MTNAEKFEKVFGAKPNIVHCPILYRKDCNNCKGYNNNLECVSSCWWNSEYKEKTDENS